MLAERWITLLGMADRAAVKAVNRSDLWHPYGHLKQREMQLLVHSPLIMINGNFERKKPRQNCQVLCQYLILHHVLLFHFSFAVGRIFFFFSLFLSCQEAFLKAAWIKILQKSILTAFVKEMERADKMYE